MNVRRAFRVEQREHAPVEQRALARGDGHVDAGDVEDHDTGDPEPPGSGGGVADLEVVADVEVLSRIVSAPSATSPRPGPLARR